MMKWRDGNKDGKFYSVCLVANDNGISASKLNSLVQKDYRISIVRCGNGKLKIFGGEIEGKYDFFIHSVDKEAIKDAKENIERIYESMIKK
ncbi:MAG: hypothetical protein IJV50_03160 [Lachnospiraceae bacterium]|nr:hypothetical protein [Lachnospiraceae bacterium]